MSLGEISLDIAIREKEEEDISKAMEYSTSIATEIAKIIDNNKKK